MSVNWYDPAFLPAFRKPPVVETAMAVEFSPIPGLDLYLLSKMQDLWAASYPNISTKPGTPPNQPDMAVGPMLMMTGDTLPLRIWAESATAEKLVQTQPDRLILNWRKVEATTKYPGYFDSLRNEYADIWDRLKAWLNDRGLPEPIPVTAEFTYVNAVPLLADETPQDVVTVVLNGKDGLPGDPRFARFQIIREVPVSPVDPFAMQIQVAGETQQRGFEDRAINFTVSARAALGARAADPLIALDAAHAIASHTFAGIIAPSKKESWGRLR